MKKNEKAPPNIREELGLLPVKDSEIMIARIETKRPAMVIAAEGHAAWINRRMKPRIFLRESSLRTDYISHSEAVRHHAKNLKRFRELHAQRRKKVNEHFKPQFPRP